MKILKSITRKERRWIGKLKHNKWYVFLLSVLFFVFPPMKKFITFPIKWFQKVFGIISFSIFQALGYKVGIVDDFIIHKKLRGKWVAQRLFKKTENELEKEDVDYMILASWADRKASHRFYKKAGLTIIGLGIGILAFKKIAKHKK